jgi:DNA-directed RNA polymerase
MLALLSICVSRVILHLSGVLPPAQRGHLWARALPPHLHHVGDDLACRLLMWAEKMPLGACGFRWLKIHLSNLYRYNKAKTNFDERAAFTDDHREDIYDSVFL